MVRRALDLLLMGLFISLTSCISPPKEFPEIRYNLETDHVHRLAIYPDGTKTETTLRVPQGFRVNNDWQLCFPGCQFYG